MNVTEERLREGGFISGDPGHESFMISVVPPARFTKLLAEMLSEDAFLAPTGLRALSKRHADGAVPARSRRARSPMSTTSPANRPRACSAGTRTGADRSGSRSTT